MMPKKFRQRVKTTTFLVLLSLFFNVPRPAGAIELASTRDDSRIDSLLATPMVSVGSLKREENQGASEVKAGSIQGESRNLPPVFAPAPQSTPSPQTPTAPTTQAPPAVGNNNYSVPSGSQNNFYAALNQQLMNGVTAVQTFEALAYATSYAQNSLVGENALGVFEATVEAFVEYYGQSPAPATLTALTNYLGLSPEVAQETYMGLNKALSKFGLT